MPVMTNFYLLKSIHCCSYYVKIKEMRIKPYSKHLREDERKMAESALGSSAMERKNDPLISLYGITGNHGSNPLQLT